MGFRKIFIAFLAFDFIVFLYACTNNEVNEQEYVTVNFIIGDVEHKLEIKRNQSLSYNDVPIENKEDILGLYYDNTYSNQYDDLLIDDDITVYVKMKEKQDIDLEDTKRELIKQDYLDTFITNEYPQATIKDVMIRHDLGFYNDSFVGIFDDVYSSYFDVEVELIIEDVLFILPNTNIIRVWNNGVFYELEEAYEEEFVSKDDLIEISDIFYKKVYPNMKTDENSIIDADDIKKELIKQAYFDTFVIGEYPQATIKDVMIVHDLGFYNDSFVGIFDDVYSSYFDVEVELVVEDVLFILPNTNMIRVWNNGIFYELEDAYEQELLSKQDLIELLDNFNNSVYPNINSD